MVRHPKPLAPTVFFWRPDHLFEPNGADAFYAAGGRVLMRWGHFDSNVTSLLASLRQLKDARKLVPPVMPDATERRFEVWKKVFSTIPDFEMARRMVSQMTPRAKDAAHRRHVLTHGNWHGFTGAPLVLTVHWSRERARGTQQATFKINMKWLERLAREIEDCNSAVMFCGNLLAETYRRREADGTL